MKLSSDKLIGVKETFPNGRLVPLRVLIVAPSLDMVGGQSIQAARLFTRLSAEPSLSVSFLPVNPLWKGILGKLQKIKYVRTLLTSLLYCATLLIRVPQYDIVHVFSASYFSFLLAPTPAILIARMYGKKIVLNYRSGEAQDHLEHWPRTAIPTIRMADAVAVPSDYLVDVFGRFGLRACAIFNFVDTNQFRFRERRPLRPRFLSNRNLEPLYNVGCVLRAFAFIQRRFPDARLVVAGDGIQRSELEFLSRQLGLSNIDFIGRVSPEKMPDLYDASDVYLNGSDIDNMPGSIIEAYASGLPVVTTDAGGIPYILTDKETGLMVHRGDYRAMAAAAIGLLEDGETAANIARRAREECRKYCWTTVRAEWLNLYHRLARSEAGFQTQPKTDGAALASEDKNLSFEKTNL